MTRNLKILGVALAAAFATSAVMASAAMAEFPFEFHSEATTTTLTGKQHAGNDKFKTDGGTVECNNATYAGSQAGLTTKEASVTPTYSGCTAFFFINVPIDVNGCQYKFTTKTKVGTSFEGTTHIVCGAKPIEITATSKCTITVGSQTVGGGTVTYTNVGTGTTREITVDVALSSIHYVEDGSGTGCPNGTTKTNGTYNGSALVTGATSKGAHIGIWVA